MIHWTGAESRLNRARGNRFGDDVYAFEELIAELGAAFACAEMKISKQTIQESVSYIDGWLKILKADKKAIFSAVSQATKAVGFLKESRKSQAILV